MKIAFIGGRDICKLGGIENYIFNLASRLAESGHTPVVYCQSDKNSSETVNGFRVIYKKSRGGRFFSPIIHALKSSIDVYRNCDEPDVVHYNTYFCSFLYAWIPRLKGVKTVFQYHSFVWESPKYSATVRRLLYFISRISAYGQRNCLTVNSSQQRFLENHFGRSCFVLHSAINVPSGEVPSSDIAGLYGLSRAKYFLFLGRFDPVKNIDILLKAFDKAKIEGYKLVLAGCAQGKYNDYLRSLSCNNVIFTGAVYSADKDYLLCNCAAFCLVSSSEGSPIVLLEAMSHKNICIVSDIPANRETIGAGGIWCKAGNVEDLARQLSYTAANGDALRHLGEYNYARVTEHFTWDKIAQQYIDHLRCCK